MKKTAVAKRYAKALLEIGIEEKKYKEKCRRKKGRMGD